MTEINSLKYRASRYVQGGATEIGPVGLEWFEPKNLPLDLSDRVYYVESIYEGRLDLIAYAFYNDPHLWWFLAQYNAILDPVAETTTGRTLRIPTAERLMFFTSEKPGGYSSTREQLSLISPVVV